MDQSFCQYIINLILAVGLMRINIALSNRTMESIVTSHLYFIMFVQTKHTQQSDKIVHQGAYALPSEDELR